MSLQAFSTCGLSRSQATNNEYNTNSQPPSLIGYVPQEIITEVFKFLSPEELAKACRVCRKWNEVGSKQSLWNAFDLKKLFPALKILDEKTWQKYADLSALGLSVDDATPPDNRKIIPDLKRLFASLEIEEDAGITFLTIPQGLSVKKLGMFAQSPKEGNPTCFGNLFFPNVTDKFGNSVVDATYRIAITNSILKRSRNLSMTTQQNLVNETGCEMPKLLEVSTLAILTYISSSKSSPVCLYGDRPYPSSIYTQCPERVDGVDGGFHLVVGGFSQDYGLDVSINRRSDTSGVGAVRKF